MSRLSAFDRLDALPTWARKGARTEGKGRRFIVSAWIKGDLPERLAGAMQKTGLSASDLCRVGLLRAIREIETNGFLEVGCREPDGKGGAR